VARFTGEIDSRTVMVPLMFSGFPSAKKGYVPVFGKVRVVSDALSSGEAEEVPAVGSPFRSR
jgi:hypothetical protein